MTPLKSHAMNMFYQRQFPGDKRYRYWTSVHTISPEPPVKDFVLMKMGERWVWGMNGDLGDIDRWRAEIRAYIYKQRTLSTRLPGGRLPYRAANHDDIQRVANLAARGLDARAIARELNLTYHRAYNYRKIYLTYPEKFVINTDVYGVKQT